MKDGAQRFLLLHHPMNDHRPVFSGKTVCGVFWPWSPFAHHRRRADVICFVVSEHVLDLEIQCARRGKEEGENWRQRSRHPSVPVLPPSSQVPPDFMHFSRHPPAPSLSVLLA